MKPNRYDTVIRQIENSNLPTDLRKEMVAAILDSQPLDIALGLRHRNGRTVKTKEITQRRNTLLQKLASEYPGSLWVKACSLADEIARFPATKHRQVFEYMLAEGMKLPTTAERINQILRTF